MVLSSAFWRWNAILSLVGVWLLAPSSLAAAPPADLPADHAERMSAGLDLFRGKVRQSLNDHCIGCHGGKKTESGLDLTSREGLIHGGDSGPAVTPFKPSESLLYRRVAHLEEPGMPENEPRLPDDIVAEFERWIELGAPYDAPLVEKAPSPRGRATVTDEDRQFWSFQPLSRPQPPSVKQEPWCAGDVDRFILARLEEKGVTPSSPIDRRRWIRRVYFDVIGLPPTPEEVESFVGDPAPEAHARVIDKLLASPHFGERWARHWLDIARFAESHGYEQDYDRPHAYHYRDFVIRAMNEDMPYDRFVQWQLAGDELASDDPLAWMATGFLGAGTHATQITANQAEKERYDELDDMAATTGTAILGLTIGCARCHDHKYDPIPSRDYYRLLSTFTTTVRSDHELDLQPERTRAQMRQWEREHQPLVAALAAFEQSQLPSRLAAWLRTAQPVDRSWFVIEPTSLASIGKATFSRQPDGSYLVGGPNVEFDDYTIDFELPPGAWQAIRIEALADTSLPKSGPGRAGNGNFDLTDVSLFASTDSLATTAEGAATAERSPAVAGSDNPTVSPIRLTNARASYEQPTLEVARAIDFDPKSGWAVDPQFGKDHAAVFDFANPIQLTVGGHLSLSLRFGGNQQHNIGRFRIALSRRANTALDGEMVELAVAIKVNEALQAPEAQRTPDQHAALAAWHKLQDADWLRLHAAVEAHIATRPMPTLSKVMVTSEGIPAIRLHTQGPDFYDQTFTLKRGDLNQKLEPATQSFLQALMRAPDGERHWQCDPPAGAATSFRRAALARWIVDPEQGAGSLAARVIVNRLWQHYFGRGIVGSASDFGAQGERPTHPELLDYLARYLIEHQWRLKSVHRLILLSSVYRQGDDHDPKSRSLDPENRLLGRCSPRRLEAEAIRDAMLSASGSLDRAMFGPGSLEESQPRRSIYFTVKRSKLIPLMMLFDAPDSLQGIGGRASTTVAPQALALMNNPQIASFAHSLAARLMPFVGGTTDEAIRQGYLAALGRQPDPDELREASLFLVTARQSYAAAGKSNALELAMTDFCRSLFSLNEFVYVE